MALHIDELTPLTRDLSGLRERKYDRTSRGMIVDLLCALAIYRRGDDVSVGKLVSFFQFVGFDLKYQGLES